MKLRTCIGAFFALLVLAWFGYRVGLSGDFLFDDYANLPALGATGPIDSPPAFWRYVTSGTADPTGRPLAMASFLLNAHDWPANPYPFKLTNLILHLFIGAGLFTFLRKLGRLLAADQTSNTRIDCAAALGTGFWLLHPLFVSTTLYIVQREAMLPALFTVLGLFLWLQGREAFGNRKPVVGMLLIGAGLGACTALAILSKANGALLPVLALTIEFAFLRPLQASDHSEGGRRLYRRTMAVCAGIPTVLVGCYLAWVGAEGLTHGISRPWTLGERLLTEPRILMDYLGLLWFPRPFTSGLFNDHIVISTGLLTPSSTLPAVLAVGALIGFGILARRRLPAVAAALLFFFVGQSMESSTLPLELYFEHRNYLPALLMFWPLALWLSGVPQTATPNPRPLESGKSRHSLYAKGALATALLAGLTSMTHARASLWGDTHDQALLWAALNPDSPRAQASAGQAEIAAGHPELAVERLRPALARAPDEAQLALNLLAAECSAGHVSSPTMQSAIHALATTRDTGTLLASWFERVIDHAHSPACPQLDPQAVQQLLDAAATNPSLTGEAGRRQDLDYLLGRLALSQGDVAVAAARFDTALRDQVRVAAALRQAALLGASGYPLQGLQHLALYDSLRAEEEQPSFGMPRVHAWVLRRQGYWDRELDRLRATLREDAHYEEAKSE